VIGLVISFIMKGRRHELRPQHNKEAGSTQALARIMRTQSRKWKRKNFSTQAAGGCRKHKFWTTRVKSIKFNILGILVSRAIDWYLYESNRRGGWVGGGSGGVQSFFRPPLPNIYWVTPTKF